MEQKLELNGRYQIKIRADTADTRGYPLLLALNPRLAAYSFVAFCALVSTLHSPSHLLEKAIRPVRPQRTGQLIIYWDRFVVPCPLGGGIVMSGCPYDNAPLGHLFPQHGATSLHQAKGPQTLDTSLTVKGGFGSVGLGWSPLDGAVAAFRTSSNTKRIGLDTSLLLNRRELWAALDVAPTKDCK